VPVYGRSRVYHPHHAPLLAGVVLDVGELIVALVPGRLPGGGGLQKVLGVGQDPLKMRPACADDEPLLFDRLRETGTVD